MSLWSRLRDRIEHRINLDVNAYEVARTQMEVLKRCCAKIAEQEDAITTLQKQIITDQRQLLDVAYAWRISMESPEIDIRDDVDEFIDSIRDELAKIEEHVL